MTGRRAARRAVRRRRGGSCPSPSSSWWLWPAPARCSSVPELRALWREDPRVDTGAVVPRVAAEPTPVLAPLTPPRRRERRRARRRSGRRAAGQLDVGIVVEDAVTGTVLVRQGSGTQTPASTMKVLSSLVALDVLGPDTRFATKTVLAGNQVVLVGEGDPLLASAATDAYPARASTAGPGERTAVASRPPGRIRRSGSATTSLFDAGWHPEWPDTFRWSVAPITALTADHGRPDPQGLNRVPTPRVTPPTSSRGGSRARASP